MEKFSYEVYGLLYTSSKFTMKRHDGTHVETRLVAIAQAKPQLVLEEYFTDRTRWVAYDIAEGDEIVRSEIHKTHVCFRCFKPATQNIGFEFFCDRHFETYKQIVKTKIRDNMYYFKELAEYNTFEDYYGMYVVNEQDLNFPCVLVVHDDTESGAFGYVVSKNMIDGGQINDLPV